MFQKSFQILTVCALATLAAIVGYAALRLNGPEDTLARAEAKFAAGRFGEVVSDLQLAQRGARFARSPELQARLWRLRYQAYSELDDPRSALTDLQLLLEQVGDDEPALQLDEIISWASSAKVSSTRPSSRYTAQSSSSPAENSTLPTAALRSQEQRWRSSRLSDGR